MDEFEQRSREIARTILERHGWKRPMSAEVKEMREIADEPLMECKRYLLEEWQNMRIPLLEAENEKLRELAIDMWRFTGAACRKYPRLFDPSAQGGQMVRLNALDVFEQRMRELGIEVDV